ncbi:MAG: hypothetical protein F6K31_17750 [Symploca sp. SIO2G7]|nr:hypothetical protein [Symploca sp. SIO2G7]
MTVSVLELIALIDLVKYFCTGARCELYQVPDNYTKSGLQSVPISKTEVNPKDDITDSGKATV